MLHKNKICTFVIYNLLFKMFFKTDSSNSRYIGKYIILVILCSKVNKLPKYICICTYVQEQQCLYFAHKNGIVSRQQKFAHANSHNLTYKVVMHMSFGG